ncbi:MAG: PIN domain-containing protein [Deltaproteobacteria bacterium]|nr:PIN domain-containing protein [Deltaproteobacteria bacterium]
MTAPGVALIDTGPLVALLDAADAHHERCVAAFRELVAPPVTTWPVLTEASYLLADVPGGPAALLELVRRGAVTVSQLDAADVPRLAQLLAKYADLPADLADCSLLRVAEREGLRTILTLDRRDFGTYRLPGRTALTILP